MQHQSETKRFILRPFRMSDLDDFFELDSDPEVHQFLGQNPVKTKEDMIPIIQGVLDQYERNGIGRWAIEDKETGEVVGWSGLKLEEQAMDFPYYDVGYRLKKKHWGKGIATEVGMESMRYGFVEMGLPQIGAGAEIEHEVSNHILKKIGLKYAATVMSFGKQHHYYEVDQADWLKENEL